MLFSVVTYNNIFSTAFHKIYLIQCVVRAWYALDYSHWMYFHLIIDQTIFEFGFFIFCLMG